MKNSITLKTTLKYFVVFLLLATLAAAKTKEGVGAASLGLLFALLYSRENPYILAVLYLVSNIVWDFSLINLLYAGVPAAICLILGIIHNAAKKPYKMLEISLAVLVAFIPRLIFETSTVSSIIVTLISLLVAQSVCYASIVLLYAILVRGFSYRFTTDEIIAFSYLTVLAFMGFASMKIDFFSPYAVFTAFLLMLSVAAFSTGQIFLLNLLPALGCFFATGEVFCFAVSLTATLAALGFKNRHIAFSFAAVCLTLAADYFYFGFFGDLPWYVLLIYAFGLISFFFVPKRAVKKLSDIFVGEKEGIATRSIVNKNRIELSEKLKKVSDVFSNMQRVLNREGIRREEDVAKKIAESFCAVCPNAKDCFSALGGDTSFALAPIVSQTAVKEKVTLLDMPAFFTGHCKRLSGLLQKINEIAREARARMEVAAEVDTGRVMIAEQMQGVAQVMSALSLDIKKPVTYDLNLEKRLIDELSLQRIVCREAIVYGDKADGLSVNLMIRDGDIEKDAAKAASMVLGVRLMEVGVRETNINGATTIHLKEAPKFQVCVGEAKCAKEGSPMSGDHFSFLKPTNSRFMMVLSDGMGSGEDASKSSESTLSMVESFYLAGFNSDTVLPIINKLLLLLQEEKFSALDIAVIDLDSGGADFIKMGARESLIIHREGIEIIEGKALPMGIVEEMTPDICRVRLSAGDMVVMMTDGILDMLSTEEIQELFLGEKTRNPHTVANKILNEAKRKAENCDKPDDDMAVICARLF